MVAAIRARWVVISMGLWGLACAGAMGVLLTYANTAGEMGGLREGWVVPASFERPADRAMLVVFAHPKCPCTRATMSAIERLQREVPGGFATRVVFYEPDGADATWRGTDLWARAQRLVDADAIPDPGGAIATGAGARVSGCVALFDRDGALLFWGGITPARGHEGESVGLGSLRSVLRGERGTASEAPVYGCELMGEMDSVLGFCGEGVCDAD
jgi:hypothetical protein